MEQLVLLVLVREQTAKGKKFKQCGLFSPIRLKIMKSCTCTAQFS